MTAFVRYTHDGGTHAGVLGDGAVHRLGDSLAELWRRSADEIRAAVDDALRVSGIDVRAVRLLAPIDSRTPMWAAGVTYLSSRDARMEESDVQDVYERVYDADRPEIFFKAQSHEVVTSGDPVGRRVDSTNDTPEPELVVVANANGHVVAFGVANDMSSRSIEGENPLYLPQAKVFAASAVLGPTLRVAWEIPDPRELTIEMEIRRGGAAVFSGSTSTARMKRGVDELLSFLFAGQAFPEGVVLSTGTCVVPPLDEPTLDGDEISIRIDGVGSTVNTVTPVDTLLPWWRKRLDDTTLEYRP
jgi:2-dehydro-3-deoxy-D-arabinonate dehydratase